MTSKRIKKEADLDHCEEPPKKKKSNSLLKFKWEPEDVLSEDGIPRNVSHNICRLLDEGSSIPFLARYRRHQTNGMAADDLRYFQEKYESLKKVRVKVEKLAEQIDSENKLSSSLKNTLSILTTHEEFELVSTPFKPAAKQTLAARARAIPGLCELAEKIMDTPKFNQSLSQFVTSKIEGRKTPKEVETALSHILTDIVVHNADVIQQISHLVKASSMKIRITSSQRVGKADPKLKDKYQVYHDFSVSYHNIKPHQILALNRGVSEKFLSMKITFPDNFKLGFIKFCKSQFMLNGENQSLRSKLLHACIEDGFKRLVLPSATRRIQSELTQSAAKASINVFAMNLRKLLLTPPLRNKIILGIDPGFKNGCKMAVIGLDGTVLGTDKLFLDKKDSFSTLVNLVKRNRVDFVALGNGTACRETEKVLTDLIRDHSLSIMYTVVNEQGASIYSCSKMAKEEFPNMDPNLISAVSIASRLRDPLAEYLKIEPKHLGVGMYQHDVSESRLKATLEEIVSECVSFVGVDLNTAPDYLLEKVSGLNKTNAKDIVAWRKANSAFNSRKDLSKIKGIGKKKFELCAGFVRIYPLKGLDKLLENPLDSTLIHPESYALAKDILAKNGFRLKDIGSSKLMKHFASLASSGGDSTDPSELILQSLGQELRLDLRECEAKPLFRKGLLGLHDLEVNKSVLSGRVTNVTHFGAFVDCGVGMNGLVHSSKMGGFNLELGMRVSVKVISLDTSKKKLGLQCLALDES